MKLSRSIYEKHIYTYKSGEVIFKEGDPGHEMFVIIGGQVEIRKSTSATSSKTLIVLEKGDIFGEMSLIDKKRRSATALATTPTRILALNDRLFDATLDGNPDFARKMIRILSERLRKTNSLIQSILMTSRENLVISGLSQFGQSQGVQTGDGYRIKLTPFVHWACDHLGISEKDLTSVLKSMLRRGILLKSGMGENEVVFRKTH